MNCVKFQDSLSDYIEGALDPRARAERAAHRLICGECRELYNDVRATVQSLNSLRLCEAEPDGLQNRIIAATTTGEMLSCEEFDRLLERYFDGVILAPTFQTFQSHFGNCFKCSRLLDGIEEAIGLLQDAKEAEVEVPGSLHDRIVAATIGSESLGRVGRAQSALVNFARRMMSPQMAVAAMIIALISLLVISRFGSVSALTMSAEQKVESLVTQGQQKIDGAGAIARSGFQIVTSGVNAILSSGSGSTPTSPPNSNSAQPSPQPSPRSSTDETDDSRRDNRRKRQNQSGGER